MTETPAPLVRRAESRAVQSNPTSAIAPADALRTVVLFTISDAFALVPEEVLWAGYHLDETLAPLIARTPTSVPLSVRHEMLEGTYAAALERLQSREPTGDFPVWDKQAAHARAEDWAAVTMQMVTECYALRPMEESTMHGRIVGLLRELGVDHPGNPRPARYLPNDVRYRLNNR